MFDVVQPSNALYMWFWRRRDDRCSSRLTIIDPCNRFSPSRKTLRASMIDYWMTTPRFSTTTFIVHTAVIDIYRLSCVSTVLHIELQSKRDSKRLVQSCGGKFTAWHMTDQLTPFHSIAKTADYTLTSSRQLPGKAAIILCLLHLTTGVMLVEPRIGR